MDNYIQTVSAVKSILAENPSARQELSVSIADRLQYVREVSEQAPNLIIYLIIFIH